MVSTNWFTLQRKEITYESRAVCQQMALTRRSQHLNVWLGRLTSCIILVPTSRENRKHDYLSHHFKVHKNTINDVDVLAVVWRLSEWNKWVNDLLYYVNENISLYQLRRL